MKARTAQDNQIRGLLGEYGPAAPQGIAYIAQRVPALIEDTENELPSSFRLLIKRLLEHLKVLQVQTHPPLDTTQTWFESPSSVSFRVGRRAGSISAPRLARRAC